MNNLRRTLGWSIVSNWAGYVVSAIVSFILTPYILHSLGETRYGVWTLTIGLTGYLGLLDLGLSSGISQYLTRYVATKNVEELNKTASTGVLTLIGCGAIVLLCSIVLAANAPRLFVIPPSLVREVQLVIGITGAGVAVQFVFFTYSAVFTALQRFDIANGIGIGTRLLSAIAIVGLLGRGYGLVALSLVLAVTNVIDYVIRWRVAKRLIPEICISFDWPARKSVTEITAFSAWSLALAGSARLISYSDSLVIGSFLPVSAVFPFAIAVNLRSFFDDVFVKAGYVFSPRAVELDARGDRDGLRQLYLSNSRFMFSGAVCLGLIGMFCAKDFFRLWLGSAYAQPPEYPSIATLFYLLIMGSIVSQGQRIGYQVLHGTRQLNLLAKLFTFEGITNLFLSIALIRHYGLLGVALGTLIPAIVVQGCFQPIFVCRWLDIRARAYCRHVLLRPIILALILATILVGISHIQVAPLNWTVFILQASLVGGAALFVTLLISLERSEMRWLRSRFVSMFVKVPARITS